MLKTLGTTPRVFSFTHQPTETNLNWTPLEPLAKEHGLALGTAAHKAGLYNIALQLTDRTIDSSSFMSTDEILKHYLLSKATLIVSEEGIAKLAR